MALYAGQILQVDLASGKVRTEPLDEEAAQKYIGGKGLGFRYLLDRMDPRCDPLSPGNPLILMTGPVTGTILPSTSRLAIVTKSPAGGTILDSNMGGSVGPEIKYAGYDGMIILGRAARPVFLEVEDDSVRIIEAGDLWGHGIFETERRLRERLGEDWRVALIGPAGERQIPFAGISSDSYRHAGRGGAGAVMGSKNLKAVAVKGSRGVKVAHWESFLRRGEEMIREAVSRPVDPARDNFWVIREGTPYLLASVNELGVLPTRNFQEGRFEAIARIDSEAMQPKKIRDRACFACPLSCGKLTPAGTSRVEGPEYETLAVAGSNCGIGDLEAIVRFNESCDDLGLDTISTGNVVAFAMEMAEKGVHDFGLRFGEVEGYLRAPEEIALQKGRGKDLSRGVRALAAAYGGREFAMEVKGLEFPGYEPRGNYGMALAYATSDRGACHLRAYTVYHPQPFNLELMAREVISHQHRLSIKNCLPFCMLLHSVNMGEMAQVLNLGMGTEIYREEDLWKAGERIWNLGRLFNLRAGLSREDDDLPARIFEEPLRQGPHAGRTVPREEFRRLLQRYYELRGWDQSGRPRREKLEELGLSEEGGRGC